MCQSWWQKLKINTEFLRENKKPWFTFNFCHHDCHVSSLTQIWDNLKQDSSQWNNITKYTKFHNRVSVPRLYRHQLLTFKQQIPKFSLDILPYSIIFSNLWKLVLYYWKLWQKCNSHEKQYCYFLVIKTLPPMISVIKLPKL